MRHCWTELEHVEFLYDSHRRTRTLRKLYRQLDEIEKQIADVRAHNHCPEHAPTALRLMREALKPLEHERSSIMRQIDMKQNDAE